MTHASRGTARALATVALAGVALAAVGFVATGVAAVADRRVVTAHLAFLALSLLLAGLAARLLRCRAATAAAGLWLAATVWFCGPGPSLAVAAMAAAALVAGWWVAGPASGPGGALACGIVVVAGSAGWILQWPVHHRLAWAGVLLGIVALGRRDLQQAVVAARRGWTVAVARSPGWALAAVSLAGLAAMAAWLPDLQADDIGYHLRLPAQLVQAQAYAPAPADHIWAYAPWLGDTWTGIAGVLAGREARGATNVLWLALAGAMAWRFAGRLAAGAPRRWLAAALVCSIPMLAGVATGQQTELPATAIALALCAEAFAPRRVDTRWPAVCVLAAGLLALKLVHAYAALPLLAVAAWRHGRGLRGVALWSGVALFAGLGLSAYVQAWAATGNPVLPLFNGLFHSPLVPDANFTDPRWRTPLTWRLPWQLAFETGRFFEDGAGALGVATVGLAGAALASMARRRWRLPMATTAAMALAPLLVLPYARYPLPGLACATVVAGVALATVPGRRLGALGASLLLAMNVLLYPAGNWLLATSAQARLVGSNGDADALVRKFAPDLAVLSRIPPGASGIVLATDPRRPDVAAFGTQGRTVSWYSPGLLRAATLADRDPHGRAWRELFVRLDARWVLVDRDHASPGLVAALDAAGARLQVRCGPAELWRIGEAPGPALPPERMDCRPR